MTRTTRFGWAALACALVLIFASCGFPTYGGFGNGGAGTGGADHDGGAGCADVPCEGGGACDPITNTCVACLPPAHPCPSGSYYCDVFSGAKTGTTCSGRTVTVSAGGAAAFALPSMDATVIYSGSKL